MRPWHILVGIFGVWAAVEFSLATIVGKLRGRFQWLIGSGDEAPNIAPDVVDRYFSRSFDPHVGWRRMPGTGGEDKTANGITTFSHDRNGCRMNPRFGDGPSEVAVFGDSYAFGRLVDDDQTWPHELSKLLSTNVRNYGVGNYGLDQALILFQRELPRLDSKVIVMGVVPETMARVHSYWKHYFEYGNILAFKPRYTLEGEFLRHHPPAVQTPKDFENYKGRLGQIQTLDPFYQTKFLRDVLKFPYTFTFFSRISRHAPILWHLLAGILLGDSEEGWRKAFSVIMRENAKFTARLYEDAEARRLLKKIVELFVEVCRDAGREPMLVVIPQPVDLELLDVRPDYYRGFFSELSLMLTVIDMTDTFQSHPARASLYVEGPLGPHPSRLGNEVIAQTLEPVISELRERVAGELEWRAHGRFGSGN